MLTSFVKVAEVDDLQDGDMRDVSVAGEEILLARIGERYYAINNICTHFFTYLSTGELLCDAVQVRCPLHDSRFSLVDGEPHALPATKPVKTYAIRVEGDDILLGPQGAS
jgi:nitrite reductase/ring-hydroxylating ferredoxin subunit